VSRAIPFDQIMVGEMLGPWSTTVTPQVVQEYCDDWNDHNPLYLKGTADGGPPVVPPAFMAGLFCFRLLGMKYNAAATIGAQTEHENVRAALVGETLIAEGRIAGKYIKRGLEYVIVGSTVHDSAGHLIRRSRDHILLSLERVGA
jgi:hypothetical protein